MSRKRYSDTINPQVAVQDYLDDLLQKLPSTSPLDELREAEEREAALASERARKLSEGRGHRQREQKPVIPMAGSGSHNYTAGRETSLAAQRLEKKRALARAVPRDFREPLTLKSPSISGMLSAIPDAVQSTSPALELPKTKTKTKADVAVAKNIPEQVVGELDSPATSCESSPKNAGTESVVADNNLTTAKAEPLGKTQDVSEKTKTTPNAPAAEQSVESEQATAAAEERSAYLDSWLDNGRPNWAQGRFECLIFTVAGLKLAVPLVSLGAIHSMDRELTPLVGRPPWFLGLLPVGEKNIKVVDSALWIMPERYNEAAKEGYRFVIRLDNSEWGMACDSVAQSFSLSPEEVRWRTDRGKRPWLAGTVIDHMCALMDVAAVAHLLDTAQKTNHSPI
ncbi:chemotaxis protein CheW [Alkalimarinus coralli]|uniref:chemotaxis protein CheW n=1 Tax=Alkalimarinus coralli TaxID=2935863 RepID=UPI00202B6694|nr:CheW domain-containing protein [Alkalimarinus coralli]